MLKELFTSMTFFKTITRKILTKRFHVNYPYKITQFHHYPSDLFTIAKKIKLLIYKMIDD